MRLIDADALKDEFPKDSDWEYPVNTNEYVCEMIDAQPTIKPERPKGDWIKLYRGTIAEGLHCSVCGKHGYRSDFCPNCGADMRGEQHE